jgi:hypothetical protein
MSFIVLTGRWCNILILTVHAPGEEKGDDSKDKFNEQLEQVFNNFRKYHIEIPSGDFITKMWLDHIFKPKIGNESLHQDSNDDGVRIENFATSKNPVIKSRMFSHLNVHKYSWTSPAGKTHNQIGQIVMDRRWHSSTLMYDLSGELTVILITIWWLQNLWKEWQ